MSGAHLLEGVGHTVKNDVHRPKGMHKKGQRGEGPEQVREIGDVHRRTPNG